MIFCDECEQQKTVAYNEKLDTARKYAKEYARQKGLKEMVIYETINGNPGWCESGDDRLTRRPVIEYIPLFD